MPKPMLKVAGKPVMDYILDDLQKLGGVEQVIYITGHLKENGRELRTRRRAISDRSSWSRRSRTARPAR